MTGKDAPTPEELEGFVPAGGAPSAAGGDSERPRGLPFFWLNVLCNQVRAQLGRVCGANQTQPQRKRSPRADDGFSLFLDDQLLSKAA